MKDLYPIAKKVARCHQSCITEEQLESAKRLDELFMQMAMQPQPNKRKHIAYLLTSIGIGFIIALFVLSVLWVLIFG